ncbi:hypothetical protein niasHT_006999 [Heterodera trifolii]|uniref:Carboxylesterase type B domain-containing protein n=1 Tax=Heterodera trifolii TaxID=157864 RepID=A0ABD2LX92_9BILA
MLFVLRSLPSALCFIILPFIFCHFSAQFESQIGPRFVRVRTTTGTIRGRTEKLEGEGMAIEVFFGIPYAEPPTGPLRFEKTVPLAEDGTRETDATEMPKMCVPHHRLDNWTSDWAEFSEDCLFINIFTPARQIGGANKPLKPLIWESLAPNSPLLGGGKCECICDKRRSKVNIMGKDEGKGRKKRGKSNERTNRWLHLERTVLFLADVQFLVPFLWELREKVANDWPLFVYVNKYINGREIPQDFPPELHKSFHDSDHKYVLRHPYSSYQFDANDLIMEQQMGQMIANFARNGDPSLSDTVRWPNATRDFPFRHLVIDLPMPQVVLDMDLRRMHFWEQIEAKYPQYNLILGTSAEENGNFGVRPNSVGWPQMLAMGTILLAFYYL